MDELADPDRARIAITADADGDQLLVGQHRPRANRRHPSVHSIEAVRSAQKVRGALARASDAGELDDLPGIDAHLVEGVDDALGNRVMAAAGAKRRLSAFVDLRLQADSIRFQRYGRHLSLSRGAQRPLASLSRRCAQLLPLPLYPLPLSYSPPVIDPIDPGVGVVRRTTSYPSCERMSSVTLRASIGSPL